MIEKFFHDTYKKRDGPENMIDSALGEILLHGDEPTQSAGDEEIRVSATLHGAGGVLKQGSMRRVVVRFELAEGLHIYSDPVPEGIIPTCNDQTCLLPRSEKLSLEVPMAPVDVQALAFHTGHGQNEWDANSLKHLLRLIFRSARRNPIGFLKGIGRRISLSRSAA